ncbi:hypothetical protein GCM10009799_34000 [Nocardiopsis rhodophaea]|uniref:Histidine kinase n=1 Tax=Nocardiopsis rhodophaea TaxID=280238 RepID=A0ABP5ET57_9ACTN
MDLMPYVDNLRRQLVVAAEAGSEEARVVAERLAAALEPAARLALLDALSEAADEITRDFAPGSVEVRLRGGQTDFIVTSPLTDEPVDGPPGGGSGVEDGPVVEPVPLDAEDGGTSRVTLRLPVHLKPQVEEAARREGLSVNAWLVRAVAAGLDAGARPSGRGAGRQVGRNYTGWVR